MQRFLSLLLLPWSNVSSSVYDRDWDNRIGASVRAYSDAYLLAVYHFFSVYLTPNELHALARFNELVSCYWLGKEVAVLVRRPRLLCLDAHGRLHNPAGTCIEYCDGWGCYAWHGVRVPERLAREDVLQESNVEIRRVMQERMGERFLHELGGQVIDCGPRGTLYEVHLPDDDLEGVARYLRGRMPPRHVSMSCGCRLPYKQRRKRWRGVSRWRS